MELTFLGTSCMVPTKQRNVAGVFLKYKNEGILIDCGEGTQRQMNITGIKRTSVTKILVSHWHGDHVSGIVGLIQTVGNDDFEPVLDIYGPKGTKFHMEHLMKSCIFDTKVELRIHELDPKKREVLRFIDNDDFALECAALDHNVPCIGFSFIEKDRLNIDTVKQKKLGMKDGPHLRKLKDGKNIEYEGKEINFEDVTYLVEGKKITIIADTALCDECILLAKEANLLVSESAFSSKLQEKAEEKKHMSGKDAAMVANQANAEQLILTHFSQRYKNTLEVEEDARTYFDNVLCAEDFMKINL